jgi:hypothetical protein
MTGDAHPGHRSKFFFAQRRSQSKPGLGAPNRPEVCRQRAEECERAAARVADAYRKMSRQWREMAERQLAMDESAGWNRNRLIFALARDGALPSVSSALTEPYNICANMGCTLLV